MEPPVNPARFKIAMIKVAAPGLVTGLADSAVQALVAAAIADWAGRAAIWVEAQTVKMADGAERVQRACLAGIN